MGILQDTFEAQAREHLSFHKVGTSLIQKRLEGLGIALTHAQLAEIESKLQNIEGRTITFNLEESQLPFFSSGPVGEAVQNLQIDLADSGDSLTELIDGFSSRLSEAIPDVVDGVSQTLLERLKSDAPLMLRHRKKDRASFESRLARVWRKPMNLLETFLVVALEAGDDFNREFRAVASQENDYVFEVLTRLHARGCQIASEIMALLRSGHADGAHARWRSLHEVAVVGFLIKSASNETAEKYLLHEAIESYKAAKLYQQHCQTLGYEPLSEEEFKKIEANYQFLIARFGLSYRNEYGWAASLLGRQDPTLKDLEQHVGLAHLRPFYKMASHNVHANPKSVFFKLGLCPSSQDILLAGPSNTGLADPAHATAISLAQITVALLTTKLNIDRLVTCQILTKLEHEIGEEFLTAQKSLEKDGVP
ncbi:MAG: DUF5677 domain-containing protein [Candidatus Binatia bacterium]